MIIKDVDPLWKHIPTKLQFPTLQYLSVGKVDMGNTRLNFWDLGGQEELQSLWDKVKLRQYAISNMSSDAHCRCHIQRRIGGWGPPILLWV